MVAGSWLDPDGKFRQYGTSKAVPEVGGDYLAYGETRCIELTISLASLTALPLVQSYTTFFPASNTQLFVEKIVLDCEVTAVGATATLQVGTGFLTPGTLTNPPAVTAIAAGAFINNEVVGNLVAGKEFIYTNGAVTGGGTAGAAGTYIGTTSADQTHKNYITAQANTALFTAGQVKVRIYYRGFGTITQ